MSRAAVLALLLAAAPARADGPVKIAVLDLEPADEADRKLVEGLSAFLATKLSERPGARVIGQADIRAALGFEKEKTLLGCEEASCLAELGGALGARFLVHGQLTRVGRTLVVNASAVDVQKGTVLARGSETVASEDALVGATARLADRLAAGLGLAGGTAATAPAAAAPGPSATAAAPAPPPTGGVAAARDDFGVRLRVGNALSTLPSAGSDYALAFDLELDVPVLERLDAFASAGTTLGAGTDGLGLAIVPLNLGVRWLFRAREQELVPYALGGVSAQLLNPDAFDEGSSLLGGRLGLGIGWLPFDHGGLELELAGDLGGGTVDGEAGLGGTFGLDVAVALLF